MHELIPLSLVISVGLAFAGLQAGSFDRAEARLIMLAFAAHVGASFAQVWFTVGVYGSGDMNFYADTGELLGVALRTDFSQFFPEVLKLLFHREAMFPFEVAGQGSSTGSMMALTTIIEFFTGGGLYTVSAALAIGSHFGLVALYRAFRSAFPAQYHRRLMWAAMLIPSEIFWSSGIMKESVAALGLGYVVWGVANLVDGHRIKAMALIAFGSPILGLFKPYILIGIIAGSTGWVFFNSPDRRSTLSKPINVLGAAVVAGLGAALMVRVFPQYSPENLAEQAAYLQEVGQNAAAGSSFSVGDPTETSLAGQLAFAPFALLTALFRPILFEARSPQVFVNAIETTAVLVFFFRAAVRRPLGQTWTMLKSLPMLMFALIFILVFGVGVGLTSTNLGTLSRYRMPLVPFLWSLVLVLTAKAEALAEPERLRIGPGGRWIPAGAAPTTARRASD